MGTGLLDPQDDLEEASEYPADTARRSADEKSYRLIGGDFDLADDDQRVRGLIDSALPMINHSQSLRTYDEAQGVLRLSLQMICQVANPLFGDALNVLSDRLSDELLAEVVTALGFIELGGQEVAVHRFFDALAKRVHGNASDLAQSLIDTREVLDLATKVGQRAD